MEAKAKVLRGIDPSVPETTVCPGQVVGQVTLDSYCWPWIKRHDVSHNTILSYTSALQKWIVPRFGAMAMGEIGTGDMAEFLREHDKLGQHERTKKLKAILSALFQVAAEDKSVPEVKVNPVRGSGSRSWPASAAKPFPRGVREVPGRAGRALAPSLRFHRRVRPAVGGGHGPQERSNQSRMRAPMASALRPYAGSHPCRAAEAAPS